MRRKVVHGKVQGQRQKDRKVVGIFGNNVTLIDENYRIMFRETMRNYNSLTISYEICMRNMT